MGAYTKSLLSICAFCLQCMHIYEISLSYIELPYMLKPKCTYTKALFRIYTFRLTYMRIFSFRKCAYTEAKMRIYGREIFHMRILDSVYAHLRKPKCAYTEAIFRICAFYLLYMRILASVNAHIRKLYIQKRASIYAHFGLRKYAYTEGKMYIYGRELP
jgi:hypothetical protein